MFRVKRLGGHALPVPARQTAAAAGFDLSYAGTEPVSLRPGQRELLSTGFAWTLPQGTVGRIAPRSGLAVRNGLDVLAGVVDQDYTGEVKVLLINHGAINVEVLPGDRIAQMLIQPVMLISAVEVEELQGTERGEGGFGSTGVATITVPPICQSGAITKV